SPIGAPGCPEFAFCTASIDRVRMVSIASFSIPGWGTGTPDVWKPRCQADGPFLAHRRVRNKAQVGDGLPGDRHGMHPGLFLSCPPRSPLHSDEQMSDTRAAIRELRSLSEKRSTQGLTEQERSRLAELRERLGLPSEPAEVRAGGPQPGGTAAS